ncbi:alpha/beta hydrolase [Micromonospora sp. WMMD998]|uniref:alpha/beta fold hydrolase n=1 Tax=Micromonospora sp. WMMD998 TaxID=3016092 RepID=UPI00249B33A7|nr:alpha/beta hydrolase [Micromonospora sp. WMMD998]WFE39911.1 alpha/beta hydrolase [Micromonospora sp. WMMD998]
MNDLDELKRYIVAHARGQGIGRLTEKLAAIEDDGDGPGSWVAQWSAAAADLERRGEWLPASRHHIMARFPYPDRPARARAAERATATFERWRVGRDLHPLDFTHRGHPVRCWQSGLSPTRPRPLVVIMGGHLTVKEQWAPRLGVFRRLGLAAVVADIPGIGGNTVPYDADAHLFLSSLLDAVGDRADVRQTYAITLSFSGHLALRCAVRDQRLRGIVTAGAPIRAFFTDPAWQAQLPRVTTDTLSHLTGTTLDRLGDWAISAEHLAALRIPVAAVASTRDEIIPRDDLLMLRDNVRDFRVLTHDDVHGAPKHTLESMAWTALSIQRMRGRPTLPLRLLVRAARLRAAR